MKLISIMACLVSMGISGTASAECPSQLTADNMHECIMMEGNGDLSYQKWAPEFYREFNPGKAATIKAAYENPAIESMQANTENREKYSLSASSTK